MSLNWYRELLVGDKDIRLPNNHVKLTPELRFDDDLTGKTFWALPMKTTTASFYYMSKLENGEIHYPDKHEFGLPNCIKHWDDGNTTHISVEWWLARIGPETITLEIEDGEIQRCFMFFISNKNVVKQLQASMTSSRYNPLDTEFCKDVLTRMELSSILSGRNFMTNIKDFINEQ